MKVIDNFLPDDVFENIQNKLWDTMWIFQKTVAIRRDKEEFENSFYTHIAYKNDVPVSEMFEHLQYFHTDKRLGLRSMLRLVLNAYPYTPKLYEHSNHYDFFYKHKGAILYLNTCDGYTFVEGQRVQSIANRVLLHDPSKLHHSTTTTNAQRRVICNLNYF